jgi:hypothetical protein
MIQIIRNVSDGTASGMFRVWCEECGDHVRGNGRSRYQSFWSIKRSAERAAQHHQNQHTAKAHMKDPYIYGNAKDQHEPNPDVWQFISEMPAVAVEVR